MGIDPIDAREIRGGSTQLMPVKLRGGGGGGVDPIDAREISGVDRIDAREIRGGGRPH